MNEYEEPSEESFQEEEPRLTPKGILFERPKKKDAFAALLMGIICIIFSLIFWHTDYANLLWVSRESVFSKGEYWRLLTALFTHSGLEHLLSNLPLFVIFGWLLRTYFGFIAFPLAAVLVGVLSNLATLYFYPDSAKLIGASGMVYGIVALWVTFYVTYEVRHSVPMKIFRALGFCLVLLFPAAYNPNTSYLAHAFGFGIGIMMAIGLNLTGIYSRRQKALQETLAK